MLPRLVIGRNQATYRAIDPKQTFDATHVNRLLDAAYAHVMGLFDKISKAVDDAVKTVQESGVVDDVVEAARSAGQSIKDSGVVDDVVAASKDAAGSAKDAYQNTTKEEPPPLPEGVVAPGSLITIADVNEVTGYDYDHAYLNRDSEWISQIVSHENTSQNGYFDIRVAKAPDGEDFSADSIWEFLVTEVSPQDPVEGLNPGAFRSAADTIFFRHGETVIHTAANFRDDSRTGEWCEELARRAYRAAGGS